MAEMRLTRHNGRAGKDGVFSVKHNDRQFDIANADHIDIDRASENIYWDMINGLHSSADESESSIADSFESVEQRFYAENFQDFVEGQNERNRKSGHAKRNRTTEDIRHDRRTCPEESIYQIGTMNEHVSSEVLLEIATDFMDEMEQRYGSHVHILDWSLHLDEATPHIHERHVFDCKNQYGEVAPLQEKALQALGFELPYPDKKSSRYNHRKMSFDATCRELMFDIAQKHGVDLDREPTNGSRKHVEKQEYIIGKQKERIEEQQAIITNLEEVIAGQNSKIDSKEDRLNDLTMKIEDLDSFIDEISEVAYDNAVETVATIACAETQKEDMKIISSCKDWLTQPDRQAPKEYRDYSAKRLDAIINKLQKASARIFEHVKQMLTSPQKRRSGIEKIKAKTRESIRKRLRTKKKEVASQEEDHPEQFIERQHQRAM